MAWSKDETLLLITLWSEDSVQAQIKGCKRNREVYEKLAAQMGEAVYHRTGQQCREKMKMKGDYSKIKDYNNETGRARWSSAIFEAMDKVSGQMPATCPPVVLDTLSTTHEDIAKTSCTGEVTSDVDGEGESTATTGSSTPCSSVSSGQSFHTAEDNASRHVINERTKKKF